MIDINQLHTQYREYLTQNGNPERAVHEKAYLYSDHEHYGLSAWQMGKYFKGLDPELKKLSKAEALEMAVYFWGCPSHEEKILGLHVLNVHQEVLELGDMPLIEKLMRESRGWVYLDSLIIPLMPVILSKDRRGYEYLKQWIQDGDFWVRRSALLAQLLFFRKGGGVEGDGIGGDRELFFEMARSQFDEGWINQVYTDTKERERARFFIRKAIGWVLREMSVKNPEVVRAFLDENEGKMSGLSYREGSKRLVKE